VERPEPGSFYLHALDVIRLAHPDRTASWQRQRAREVMTAAFEERRKLLPDDAGDLVPTFPRTSEELANLAEDFKVGEDAGEARWRTPSTGSGDRGKGVEVAQVRGIICIRRGGSPQSAMYLTTPDWYIFAKDLESTPARLTERWPDAEAVLDEQLTSAKTRGALRETGDAALVSTGII
jgi:hypothetical protein